MVFGNQSSLSFNEVQILWETLTGHFLRPEKSTFQTHWDAGSNLNRICSFLRDYNLETNLKFTSAKYSQLSQLYVFAQKTSSREEDDLVSPSFVWEWQKLRVNVKREGKSWKWETRVCLGAEIFQLENLGKGLWTCENPIGSDDTCQIVSKPTQNLSQHGHDWEEWGKWGCSDLTQLTNLNSQYFRQ